MKRLQTSTAAKCVAVLLMLAAVFVGTLCAVKALLALPCLEAESWTEISQFRQMLRAREDNVTFYLADQQRLAQPDLTYLDRQQLENSAAEYWKQTDPSATMFRFQVKTADGLKVLCSNLGEGEVLSEIVETVYYDAFQLGGYGIIDDAGWSQEAAGILSGSASDPALTESKTAPEADGSVFCIIECGVVPAVPDQVSDEFASLYRSYQHGQDYFSGYVWTSAALLVLALFCLLYLLWGAGHKAGTEDVTLSWQDRIFFDAYLFVMLCVGTALFAGGLYLGENLYYYGFYHEFSDSYAEEAKLLSLAIAALAALFMGVAALTLRTLVVRCKARMLAHTTLLCRVVGWMVRTIRDFVLGLPLTWRVAAAYAIFFLANVMLLTQGMYNGFWILLWFILHIGVLLALCWWSLCFHRLRKGSQAIAAGNLSYQLDTARMPHDLKAHAEDLNNISAGLSSAVDEQMKSERFKAELITNVSHDLKTPLTSIINYVDLLKTTEQHDPRAQDYIEVLDRKAQRLKKLTEDLVEASKASTGVLTVNREKIGMAQLMDQALGEWTEKLEARKLTVVTSLPEGETWVYADGRHLWRVIDNLLSNCAKYAMEGTRIYLDLTRGKGRITLSVKNISREPLNVPPERLMERFVRGEESRTTEGSGLGLSIARSLTELQGGTFDLAVDGDLFKATVSLPQAN